MTESDLMGKKKKPLRILLVEDNKFDREIFKEIFKSAKVAFEITECVHAEEGLDIVCADASKFDVAVIDNTLPGMTGLELCKTIHNKNLELPLVLLTGTGSEEVAVEALEIGIDDYIIKGSEIHKEIMPLLVERVVKRHKDKLARIKTEETLRISEERRSLHLKQTPLGVIEWDAGFKVTTWNPAAEKMFGFSAEEALGKHAYEIIVPESECQNVEKVWSGLLQKKGGKRSTNENITKDGRTILCEWYNTPLVDDSGKVLGVASIVQDVTDSKKNEEALLSAKDASLSIMEELQVEIEEREKVEGQLRKLTVAVEQNPATIAITDPKGNIEYVNPEFTVSSGYTAEEANGQNPRILKSGNQPEEFYKELWETITAGKTWRGDFQNRKKNGELYWESASISSIVDEKGNITHFIAIKTDVTVRKAQEEEIRRQHLEQEILNYILALSLEDMTFNELLERCLDEILSIPFEGFKSIGSILTVDEDAEILTMAVQRGLNRELLERCRNVPFGRCLCGRAAKSGTTEFAACVDERHEITYEGMSPHGHYCVPIKTQKKILGVINLYLDEGCSKNEDDVAFLESVAATIAGIIERKKMEAKVKESEKKYRDIINTTREGYWRLDMEIKILDVNESLCTMLGYSQDEMIGKTLIDFVNEENAKIFREQTSKIPLTSHRVYEITLKRKDGKTVPTIVHSTTIKDSSGGASGVFAFIADISDLKKTEAGLRLAKEGAEEATRLKDKFVSLVSHDLKNPISRIMLYLDMLKATEQLSSRGKEMIVEGVETLDEMTSLINDVLSLTRIKGARIMPEYALSHLQGTVELAIKNYHRLADEKEVGLINAIPETVKIFADERLILEVLRNLISNAVKFCRKGGRIRVYLADGKRTTIAVSDTGVGIKPENMDTLFKYEQKTSTKGTSGERGTGFGLPLCHDIVAAHGGRLHVESEVGKGTTFYVKLPDIKPTVLIVDDDESVRRLFIKRLEKQDIVIVEADNGEAAIELIKTRRPQLFFVDLHMPGMSGLELLRQIKGDPETEKIPVIVVTADKTMEVVDHAFMEGADDFIVKPFEKEELIESVERFIG